MLNQSSQEIKDTEIFNESRQEFDLEDVDIKLVKPNPYRKILIVDDQ